MFIVRVIYYKLWICRCAIVERYVNRRSDKEQPQSQYETAYTAEEFFFHILFNNTFPNGRNRIDIVINLRENGNEKKTCC